MGITIGDCLTVISILAALAWSTWALLIGISLLTPHRAQVASETLRRGLGKPILSGAVIGFIWVGLGLALLGIPNPIAKLLGLFALGFFLVVTATGAAGVVRILSERIIERDPSVAPFRALVGGSTLFVLATLLPLIGWFFLAPLGLLIAAGAGLSAWNPRAATVPASVSGE